jgi:bacterial/archaeal transporter family protein
MSSFPATWLTFALGSAFFAGLTAILGKVGVAGLNSNLATLIRTIVILALAAALVTARSEWVRPERLDLRSIVFLVLSGAATGLSWLCYYRALQLAPASLVAPVDKLSVVFVIVLGVVVLGEPLTWKLAAGAVLVVLGVVLIAVP